MAGGTAALGTRTAGLGVNRPGWACLAAAATLSGTGAAFGVAVSGPVGGGGSGGCRRRHGFGHVLVVLADAGIGDVKVEQQRWPSLAGVVPVGAGRLEGSLAGACGVFRDVLQHLGAGAFAGAGQALLVRPLPAVDGSDLVGLMGIGVLDVQGEQGLAHRLGVLALQAGDAAGLLGADDRASRPDADAGFTEPWRVRRDGRCRGLGGPLLNGGLSTTSTNS